MVKNKITERKTAFKENGIKKEIQNLLEEVKGIYLSDDIPWVIGYSGGKDSTASLQIVWMALQDLPENSRKKPIHVISTDTLVENPIVAQWIIKSHKKIVAAAKEQGLSIHSHLLTPTVQDSFWTNMIGKGYPAPRHKFRWCTMRLKINPSNAFIKSMVHKNGEAIVVLGTRSAESAARAKVIARHKEKRTRDKLSPNGSLPNCFVYSPIEEWSNDDVWQFLMMYKNPWGYDNKSLLTMYQGASKDGECPLVVDTNTPSCGDSRFGCWVCTLVDKDKSMTAMIQNDQDKEWMLPLLEFRNEMDFRGKEDAEKQKRDFRRMGGQVNFNKFDGKTVRGPYNQKSRAEWLARLLEAQEWIRKNGPEEVRDWDLITIDELREIRRIWLVEKHEFEDNLPKIYTKITGNEFPDDKHYNLGLGSDALKILKKICGEDEIQYEMIRELLDVEQHYRTMTRRSGLFPAIESAVKRSYYENIEDAANIAKTRYESKQEVRDKYAPIEEEEK